LHPAAPTELQQTIRSLHRRPPFLIYATTSAVAKPKKRVQGQRHSVCVRAGERSSSPGPELRVGASPAGSTDADNAGRAGAAERIEAEITRSGAR
jgi:hypothetical protein